MYRSVSAIACSSVFALAGLFSTSVLATETCDLYTAAVTTCTDDCYRFVTPVINSECDLTNVAVLQQATIFDPPPAPLLECSQNGEVVTCEAWPQSEELSYSWSQGDDTPAAEAQRDFACGSGTVDVSIMTSAGATSVATAVIPDCD